MSYVAGYTVAHDVSARDWQLHKNGGQWLLGKTFDTFCPLGPVIVTPGALSGQYQIHPDTVYVQIFEVHKFCGCHKCSIFTIAFLRITYQSNTYQI